VWLFGVASWGDDDMVADGLIIHFCYYELLIFRFVDGGGPIDLQHVSFSSNFI